MNSLGSCINTFGRYRKGNQKNELGTLLTFDLTTLYFKKYLNLSHSSKCSVSTQLTYIQQIQYNKVSISTIRTNSAITTNSLSTLRNDNFANSVILAIPDLFRLFGYLATFGGFFSLVPLCKFYKTNTDFEELRFLPETQVNQYHKT